MHQPANKPTHPIERASTDDLTALLTDVGPAPTQIGAVLVLDNPVGFDPGSVKRVIERRIGSIPRMGQRLKRVPFGCGRPIWVDDAEFDIDHHVFVSDDTAEDLEEVLSLAADWITVRLPDDRPLWAVKFVPVVGDRMALVVVFHHVLADGIGGLAVLASLVDGAPEIGPAVPRPQPSTRELIIDSARERIRAIAALPGLPRELVDAVRELTSTGRSHAARSSLNRPTGPRRRLAVARVELQPMIDLAHEFGGSVNDVVLAAVDGSMRRLLSERGESVGEIVVSVPTSRRRSADVEKLGNEVGVVPIGLPAVADPRERLRLVVQRGTLIRGAPHGASTKLLLPLFRLLARLGSFRWFISRQRLVNSFVTSLRGPGEPVTLAGADVTDVIPISGISGNVTVAFAVLSYAGTLVVTIVCDPDAMADLPLMRQFLQDELETYVQLRDC